MLTNYETESFVVVKDLKYGRGFVPYRFLKSDFVGSEENIYKHLIQLLDEKDKFNGFNLIVGNLELGVYFYISNHYKGKQPVPLAEGYYGLCNCDLFTHWPKTKYGLDKFRPMVQAHE